MDLFKCLDHSGKELMCPNSYGKYRYTSVYKVMRSVRWIFWTVEFILSNFLRQNVIEKASKCKTCGQRRHRRHRRHPRSLIRSFAVRRYYRIFQRRPNAQMRLYQCAGWCETAHLHMLEVTFLHAAAHIHVWKEQHSGHDKYKLERLSAEHFKNLGVIYHFKHQFWNSTLS